MKILIIDDEEVSLFLTQCLLVLEGVAKDEAIRTFLSAKEAISYLSKCSDINFPEQIFLDINMPQMDGWQFLDAITMFGLRVSASCKIYLLTTSLDFTEVKKAKENPLIYGLMKKPINREKIRTLLSISS